MKRIARGLYTAVLILVLIVLVARTIYGMFTGEAGPIILGALFVAVVVALKWYGESGGGR